MNHPYEILTPETILAALHAAGFYSDGGLLALNSYENRVYAFRDDDKNRFVVKFYRPARWSLQQIQEEHDFLFHLLDAGLDVIAPLRRDERSVFDCNGFYFAVFVQRGGRALDTSDGVQLDMIGRTIGRLHYAAQSFPFRFRPTLSVDHFAASALAITLQSPLLPATLMSRYQTVAETVLQRCRQRYAALPDLSWISCHGDLHVGNILWTGETVLLCDFDDARTAPAIQDLWMLIHSRYERDRVIDEYETFNEFDWRQCALIEVQRSLRMIQYTGWLAARWNDPTFPRHFPWFGGEHYFLEQISALNGQLSLIEEDAVKAM